MAVRAKGKALALAALALILAGSAATALLIARAHRDIRPSPEAWPGVEAVPLVPEGQEVLGGTSDLLLVGLSQETAGGKTFKAVVTLVAVRLDERRKRAACLFFPRTTYLEIKGYGRRTVDELYELGGLPLLRQSVQDLTGMVFDHYLLVERPQFAWLVDLSGGVPHTLEQPISDPRWGSLEAGATLLDGNGAALINSYQGYQGGETGRVKAQQSFLLSAAAQLHRAASRLGFAWTANLAYGNLLTDLSQSALLGLAREFASWPAADLSVGTAPGQSGSIGNRKVYLLDSEAMRKTVESMRATATVPAS